MNIYSGKPRYPGVPSHQQTHYKHVKYFTYYPVLGSFNNWNIILFSHNATSTEYIDTNNQVILDIISENMSAFVKAGNYGDINITDTSTMG